MVLRCMDKIKKIKEMFWRKITKETVQRSLTVYHPSGQEINWKSFLPFFEDPEPSPDIRKRPRPQRRLFIVSSEGKRYHIKKFSYFISPRFRDKFRGFIFQRTAAKRQMLYSLKLNRLGIKTVFPYFAIEKRKGFKKESLFITPFIKRLRLFHSLQSTKIPCNKKIELFRKAVKEVYLMHSSGIFHGDAHTQNILVDDGDLLWCDLDRTKKSRLALELRGRYLDCSRLFRSAIAALISSGDWNSAVRKEIIDICESEYPGHERLKIKVYIRTSERLEDFDYVSIKNIVREKPAPDITGYHPQGCSLNWRDFEAFLDFPEPLKPEKITARGSRRVFIFKAPSGRKYHIKKFSYEQSPRLRDRFRGFFFQSSKARRQAVQIEMVRNAGLKTAFPWFAMESRKGLKKHSLFITPYEDAPNMSIVFSSPEIPLPEKYSLLKKALGDLNTMHKSGVYHIDTHIKNLLVCGSGLLWCDLDDVGKNWLRLITRGKFKDCYKLLRSAITTLKQTGQWSGDVSKDVKRAFEESYPGHGLLKGIIYRSLSKRFEKFEY